MPKTITIVDNDGRRLGSFTADDGATADEIATYYETAKRKLLLQREQREAQRTQPQGNKCECFMCGTIIPIAGVIDHMRDVHKDQMPTDGRIEE